MESVSWIELGFGLLLTVIATLIGSALQQMNKVKNNMESLLSEQKEMDKYLRRSDEVFRSTLDNNQDEHLKIVAALDAVKTSMETMKESFSDRMTLMEERIRHSVDRKDT